MNCLDCQTRGHQIPAVAVCRSCGAAACDEHIHVGSRTERHGHYMGPANHTEVRTVLCTACRAAWQSAPAGASVPA